MDNGETKQSGRWQRVLVLAGVPVIFLTAILAVRIVWEETFLTLQHGPQMIGFSLAHGPAAVLLFAPLLLAAWFVVAFLTMAVTLWRKRRLSIWFWSCLGTCGPCFLCACVSFDVLAVDIYGELCKESARGGSDDLCRG
jgi:hypothetical protein